MLAACGKHEVAGPVARPAPTVQARPATDPVSRSLPGVIAARETTPLSFREAGLITQRFVTLGDTVQAGQVLATLDDTPWQQNLAAAQAQYEAARQTLAIAQRQLKRDQAQAHEKLIAPAQLDQTLSQAAQAQAQYEQALQAYAHARDQLAYTSLRADHAGIIIETQASTGQNVKVGEPVYTLAWGGTDVVVNVPEVYLPGLTMGRAAEITPTLPARQTYTARVREIARDASAATRSFQVRLGLDAAGSAPPLGTTVTVRFQQARQGGPHYVLPASALFHDGDRPAVWIVHADGTLALQAVDVLAYGASTITVTGGIAPGQTVLAQGVHTVSAGERVQAVPWQPGDPPQSVGMQAPHPARATP